MLEAVNTSTPSRIALGTAQLGMPYGIANDRGQPPPAAAHAILTRALEGGVRWFDTAQGYGTAERLLGQWLGAVPHEPVSVVTKLDGRLDASDGDAVRAAVRRSHDAVGRRLGAVLVHDPAQLRLWHGALGQALRECREAGLAAAAGASVYTPEQAEEALSLPGLGVLQAPFNVFDRRLERSGTWRRAVEQGVQVMVRSAFLQGVLMLEDERRPGWLGFAGRRLDAWTKLCADHGADPATVALRFVLDRGDATVVVGCETLAQLEGILAAAEAPPLPEALVDRLDALATDDLRLIDPTRWPRALTPVKPTPSS